MKWLSIVLVCMCCSPAFAAFEVSRSILAESAGFDPLRPAWQFWRVHPARLVDVSGRLVVAASQPYGLSDLNLYTVSASFGTGPVGLGVGFTSMGTSVLYRESDLSVAGAWAPLSWLALGAGVHLARIDFGGGFQPIPLTSWTAGIRVGLSRQWSVDGSWTDLGAISVFDRGVLTPRLVMALNWRYSESLSLRVGRSGDANEVTLGETLRVSPAWSVSADMITSPLRLRVGSLISVGAFAVDLVYRDDPSLGGDVAAALAWSW